MKDSPECARVEVGRIAGVNEGYEDWIERSEPWGYMHLKCFYLAVGDPRAVGGFSMGSSVVANGKPKVAA